MPGGAGGAGAAAGAGAAGIAPPWPGAFDAIIDTGANVAEIPRSNNCFYQALAYALGVRPIAAWPVAFTPAWAGRALHCMPALLGTPCVHAELERTPCLLLPAVRLKAQAARAGGGVHVAGKVRLLLTAAARANRPRVGRCESTAQRTPLSRQPRSGAQPFSTAATTRTTSAGWWRRRWPRTWAPTAGRPTSSSTVHASHQYSQKAARPRRAPSPSLAHAGTGTADTNCRPTCTPAAAIARHCTTNCSSGARQLAPPCPLALPLAIRTPCP